MAGKLSDLKLSGGKNHFAARAKHAVDAMNTTEHLCHYALLRFMPYREAEEFVNIGVVLSCPKTGYLGVAVERKKLKRVTDFFPEFKTRKTAIIYRDGLTILLNELDRFTLQAEHDRRLNHPQTAEQVRAVFGALTRPREAIFHFSPPRTLLTPNVERQLQQLFDLYVERQLTESPDAPEEYLRREMGRVLAQSGLAHLYRKAEIGPPERAVTFPFVAGPTDAPPMLLRAIKPLNLAQDQSGEVYRHGDHWVGNLRRLKRADALPATTLFAIRQPPVGTSTGRAAAEICAELNEYQGVTTLDFDATPRILEWARPPQNAEQLNL